MYEKEEILSKMMENTNFLNIMSSLLKEIAEGLKEANAIRKQEQTELWKEMKELKTTSEKIYGDIYRESEVRPGVLQIQKNLNETVYKIQNIVYGGVGIIAFINMLPLLKEFLNLLLTK